MAIESASTGAALIRIIASTQALAAFNAIQSLYGVTETWSIGGFGSQNTIGFKVGGTERARIRADGMFEVKGAGTAGSSPAFSVSGSAPANSCQLDSSGRLLVGTSSAYGSATLLELHSSTQFGPQLLQRAKRDDAFPTYFIGQKIRNTSIVQSGDGLFQFTGEGYDGASYIAAARVDFAVDGTPSSTAMPGRLVFSTNSGTAGASPTERLRITSAGVLQVADAGNISVGTTTGTKIGTATTQKLGFYNATPVVQPAAVADATDAASVITQLNALLARMRSLGLIAT
jgi:hypothetical protein